MTTNEKLKKSNSVFKTIEEFSQTYNYSISLSLDVDEKSIVNILNGNMDILNKNINKNLDPSYYNFIGIYYYEIEKNYSEAVKYYKMAIKLNHSNAMNNLAVYYDDIEKNYPEAVKYYKIAIKLNHSNAMCNLGLYYCRIEKNYPEAVKYYKMALDHGQKINLEMSLVNWYIHQETNCEITGEKTKEVVIFDQKSKFLSKIQECPVCLEEKKCIPYECAHYSCCSCYVKIMSSDSKKCPLCRFEL